MSFRVNLALAYTELTEELGRRELSSLAGEDPEDAAAGAGPEGGERTQRVAGATLHFLPLGTPACSTREETGWHWWLARPAPQS